VQLQLRRVIAMLRELNSRQLVLRISMANHRHDDDIIMSMLVIMTTACAAPTPIPAVCLKFGQLVTQISVTWRQEQGNQANCDAGEEIVQRQ